MTKVLGSAHTFLDAEDTDALEFIQIVCDITALPQYQKLKLFEHHHSTTRYQHCLNVAWYTYVWAKKLGLNYISAARGAMLHDFFLYDWHTGQPIPGRHTEVHPMIALENAGHFFEIDPVMKDCILHHMWPNARVCPTTAEGILVTIADKYCASIEFSSRPLYSISYSMLAHMLMAVAR